MGNIFSLKNSYTEQDLVNDFLTNQLPYHLFKKEAISLLEPRLPIGLPDIVLGTLKNNYREIIDREPLLNYSQLKLLHYIYLSKGVKIRTIEEKLLFSNSFITNNIQAFLSNNVIKIDNNIVRLNPIEKVFVLDRIVAIEAKLSNWKQVLDQARRNKWFASESYILMPSDNGFEKILEESDKWGLGVLTVKKDFNKLLLKSSRAAIPRSFGSWIVNEIAIKKLQENV